MLLALRDLFAFLLTQGLASILWVGGLGATGLLLGVFLAFGLGFMVRRAALARRRPVASGFFVAYSIVTVPLAMAIVGSLIGSAFAVRALAENPVLVHRAVELSFQGTAAALEQVDLAADQRQLVLDVVGGEETFAIDDVEGLLARVSDDTLRRLLEVYDDSWGAQDAVLGVAARELGRRLVQRLIESRTRSGRDIVQPAIDELRSQDDGDGVVVGAEIGVALVHHGVQRPLARWAFLAVLSQALIVVPALALVVLGPLLIIALYDRLPSARLRLSRSSARSQDPSSQPIRSRPTIENTDRREPWCT